MSKLYRNTENAVNRINEIIQNSQKKFQKTITFTPESVSAMERLFFENGFKNLEKIIERTVKKAERDAVITSDAVEIAVLRNSPDVDFANPWKDFSLRELTHSIEHRLIELALKEGNGLITKASDLLGFQTL